VYFKTSICNLNSIEYAFKIEPILPKNIKEVKVQRKNLK